MYSLKYLFILLFCQSIKHKKQLGLEINYRKLFLSNLVHWMKVFSPPIMDMELNKYSADIL